MGSWRKPATAMMCSKQTGYALAALTLVLFAGRATSAQRARGEMRIEVRDPQGAAVPAETELVSDANQFHRTFQVGVDGRYVVQDLAFGVYRLSIGAAGFAPWSGLVEVRSDWNGLCCGTANSGGSRRGPTRSKHFRPGGRASRMAKRSQRHTSSPWLRIRRAVRN